MAVAVKPAVDAARSRADRIKAGLSNIAPLVREAYEKRDWQTLGYATWDSYIRSEFGGPLRLARTERVATVEVLRSSGMSTRAIGAALGVSHTTIERGLPTGTNVPVDRVLSLDGRSRPSTQISRTSGVDEVAASRRLKCAHCEVHCPSGRYAREKG